MKLKFLLFALMFWGGILSAQDTINYLIITEYRGDNTDRTYLELTNMGDKPVQLNQFHIGHWGAGNVLINGNTLQVDYQIPVDTLLPPGESFAFAAVKEYGPKKFAQGLEGFPEKVTQDNMWEMADFYVHLPEALDDGTDIVTPGFYVPFNEQWGPGMNGFYIEQHFPNGDTLIVDQVLGMFTGENGQNLDRTTGIGYDIAGVINGTGTSYLIRKFSVKHGNLDFNSARGVGLDDSEWIPIPIHGQEGRNAPWTISNHGDYNLDENTLESDVIDVDFLNKTLTVPWGVQRGDDIMNYFVQKPGIGWEYVMDANADSLTHATQTGDQLLIYVCGNDLDFAAFDIVVKEPLANANKVVPVTNEDTGGAWRGAIDSGQQSWPRVTQHESGIDSIWGTRGGIPYGTRVDSLLERLEKPSNAEWEIVYVSGVTKPDLAHGDILKIIAQDGSVKEYFISVLNYRANGDAALTSITWPDIPEFYKGIFGWIGDTIPNFGSGVYNYNVQVPLMAEGIPAFITKKSDVNAKVQVDRARSLSGSVEDRTVRFTVTAEDDSTINNYSIVLTKEKNPEKVQPYFAEPFFSEVMQNHMWTGSDFLEICNPGNQPLNLSNYMIIGSNSINVADAIAQTNENAWLMRYEKYIPGYKWAPNEADWTTGPYVAQNDLAVNSIVLPGDVFLMGGVNRSECDWAEYPGATQLDVQFWNGGQTDCDNWVNQWGEEIDNNGTPCNKHFNQHIYLLKILNDSIKQGLKPATDPNDFELIDVIGMGENSTWEIPGVNRGNPFTFIRKPGIYKGNPLPVTFGTSAEDAEWNMADRNKFIAESVWWPWDMRNILLDLGKHYFETPTQYMSTVSSVVYKVSDGYSLKEQIKGITTGTTVSNFLAGILLSNEKQSLKVTSATDGIELAMDALLSINDTLTVLSADSTNTTKYVLEVSEDGLSSIALLTSSKYEIKIDIEPKNAGDEGMAGAGSITGFEYGTSLKTVLNNITIPAGATLSVINGEGAYVPLKQLNFDTTYVNVTVNANTYIDVVAENGVTRITYALIPESSESDAFVTSDLYSVIQNELLIEYVYRGTNTQSFLSNLVPSSGASMQLIDKMGFERNKGEVADDDKLVVTSLNGEKIVVYHISKLATKYTPQTTYLAYILSDVYGINQVDYKIHNVSGNETISEFYSKIKIASGAIAIVVDKDGMEKPSGNIDRGDMVKVTSADGRIVVMYAFDQLVSAEWLSDNQIELYPNPTNGKLNISGVEKGQKIQIYNTVGSVILDVNVESNFEIINLDKHPAGIYLIVISNKNRPIGRYKAIKY